MKKNYFFAIITVMILIITGCSSKKDLEGDWETVAFIQNGQQLKVLESNMNFVMQDKTLKVKGCAGVNLYYADVEVKGKKFSAYGMMNSGFMGNTVEMAYENNFFTVLMFSNSYKIEDDILTIYAPSQNMEIQLKRK